MKHTVSFTSKHNLCISCGICAAVCTASCIDYRENGGMNLPVIHEESCVKCGKCFDVCPGRGFDYGSLSGGWEGIFGLEAAKGIYIARSKDNEILRNAISGGVVTEIISALLDDYRGGYKHAFVMRGYDFSAIPHTEMISSPSELHASQKSRYVIVSHRECAEYIITHPDEKIILTGTACFVHGILNLIRLYGLKRSNYFIIGLFCDRTMSMNVIRWFKNHPALKNGLRELYFRTKDAGGWPGGVRLVGGDGEIIDLPNTERMKVKDYFQPETCLYCLDKLNVYADISAGDNYTGRLSDDRGNSSVIIRTEAGLKLWKALESRLEIHPSNPEEIYRSQHLKEREYNYFFSLLKEKETGRKINLAHITADLPRKIKQTYRKRIHKLKLGAASQGNHRDILRDIRTGQIINRLMRIPRKILSVIRKLIHA